MALRGRFLLVFVVSGARVCLRRGAGKSPLLGEAMVVAGPPPVDVGRAERRHAAGHRHAAGRRRDGRREREGRRHRRRARRPTRLEDPVRPVAHVQRAERSVLSSHRVDHRVGVRDRRVRVQQRGRRPHRLLEPRQLHVARRAQLHLYFANVQDKAPCACTSRRTSTVHGHVRPDGRPSPCGARPTDPCPTDAPNRKLSTCTLSGYYICTPRGVASWLSQHGPDPGRACSTGMTPPTRVSIRPRPTSAPSRRPMQDSRSMHRLPRTST